MRSFIAKIIAVLLMGGASYAMYVSEGESTVQYVVGASIVVYFAALYIYSKLKALKTIDLFDDDFDDEEIGEFEDITLRDVIHYWHEDQQKGIKGLFRAIPDIDDIDDPEKSDLIEVEIDVEHLIINTSLMHVNWNAVNSLTFFNSPYPVRDPTTFVNDTQAFPMDGTLKKVTCNSCSGSGQTRCYSCSGTGRSSCSSCGGSGSRMVTETTGYGDNRRTQTVSKSCMGCGGSGRQTCMSCGGSGRRTCSTCGGSGAFGQYYATIFNFLHWQNQRVFKVRDDNTITGAEITDIQNEYGQELPAFNNNTYQSLATYKSVPNFDQKVEESIQELQISAKTI